MNTQEKLGKAIQKLRANDNISQEKLALSAGIDRRYMSDIENGKRNISLDILERLAKGLSMSVGKLFELADTLSNTPKDVETLKEWLRDNDHEDTALFESPDFLSAIMGITEDGRLIYSYERMVASLIAEDHIDEDEAIEFIDYNTIRTIPYMGEKAPIIMYDIQF